MHTPILPRRDVTRNHVTRNSRDTYPVKQTKPESELALASQFTESPSSELPTLPNEFEQILTGYPAFRATTEDADEIRSGERHLSP